MTTCQDAITNVPITATVRLDTKGFCIFCLKRSDTGDNTATITDKDGNAVERKVDVDAAEAQALLRQKFSKVISRYLGTSFSFLSTPHSVGSNDEHDKRGYLNKHFEVAPQVDVGYICSDCSILVEKVCHLFHEMKKVEMELDWKTRQLKNIMAFAKRAPTRLKVLKEQFSDSGKQEDMEELARIEMYRKEVLDKCGSKFRKLHPRIIFKRKGSPKKLRKKITKKLLHDATFADAEVQTETIMERTFDITSEAKTVSLEVKRKAASLAGEDDPNRVNENDTDISPPSPSPPSPTNSCDRTTEDNAEECLIRIRTIESLASPTKSLSSEESSVRKTRPSRRAATKVLSYNEDDIQNAQLHSREKTASSTSRCTRKLTPPDLLIATSSVVSPTTSSKSKPNNELKFKKATLTEWLQSTFNCTYCNKMFISEATLSIHKATCGVVEIRPSEAPVPLADDVEPNDHEYDVGECPMDIDPADDDRGESPVDMSEVLQSSSDEENEEDPLKEGVLENNQEAEEGSLTEPTTKTCTIRVFTTNTTKQSGTLNGSRYCKYCQVNISKNHFSRHRETLKHKANKRTYKKAKKAGKVVTTLPVHRGTAATDTNTSNGSNSSKTAPVPSASSTAVVTVSQNENNVKVVKIIYVASASNAAGNQDDSNDNQQQPIIHEENENSNLVSNAGINNEADVIDISDD